MPQFNCYIPITVRLTRELTDQDLERLGQGLARTLATRILFAEQTLATSHSGMDHGVREIVREDYDPTRDDQDGYSVPSYNGSGASTRVALHVRAPRSRRPWIIRRAINFRALVDDYIEYLARLQGDEMAFKALYTDILEDVRWVSLWLVQVNTSVLLSELSPVLYQRAAELSHISSKQILAHGAAFNETHRQLLIDIDLDQVVERDIPDMSRNVGSITLEHGEVRLQSGAWMLFTTMVLPKIELADVAVLDPEILVALPIRDLTFLVPQQLFKEIYGIEWDEFLKEFGDEQVTLRFQPVAVRRRIHFQSLQFLIQELMFQRIRSALTRDTFYFGQLDALNNSTLDQLPAAVRPQADVSTNDVTRALDQTQVADHWLPTWKGGYFLAVVNVGSDRVGIVLFRAPARQLVPALLAKLDGDPVLWDWNRALLNFLDHYFGADIRQTRPPGGTLFEFVLAELEQLGKLDLLFDKVEESSYPATYQRVIRLSLATRYADHPRVRRSYELLLHRVLQARENIYRPAEREIWLERDEDRKVKVGQVFGDVRSIYIFERKEKQLKETRAAEFRAALKAERQALIANILSGKDTSQYTEDSFAKATIAAAAQDIHLTNDDFETVTVQRSMRLLGVEVHTVEALTRFYITFEFVERVVGKDWQSVSAPITEIEDDFEARLIYWSLGRTAEVYKAIGIAVVAVGFIAIAWEVGLVGLLVDLAGGTTAVLLSIGISELIYILRVIFGDAKLTLFGFLEAALDGYLMAVGFRGAGLLGRAAARVIGTQSLERIIGGWALERLIAGTVGGAATAALTRFSHDLIKIATGDGGWSSIGDYVRDMTWGALFGTVFEFGTGALGPLVRASGENAFETIAEVVNKVRSEGLGAVQWTKLTTEALGKMRASLKEVIGDVAADGFVKAMGSRLAEVTEQLGAKYRLAVFRRVLELSPEAMSREALGGLETFLNASEAELSNESALAVLNTLKPEQLRTLLETLGELDHGVIQKLAKTNQLADLATDLQAARRANPGRDIPLLQIAAKLRAQGHAGRLAVLEDVAQQQQIVGFGDWVTESAGREAERMMDKVNELLEARRLLQEHAGDPSVRIRVTQPAATAGRPFDIVVERPLAGGGSDILRRVDVYTPEKPITRGGDFITGFTHAARKIPGGVRTGTVPPGTYEGTIAVQWPPPTAVRGAAEKAFDAGGGFRWRTRAGAVGGAGNLLDEAVEELNGITYQSPVEFVSRVTVIDQSGRAVFEFNNTTLGKAPATWTWRNLQGGSP
jgi:hypothetical protein